MPDIHDSHPVCIKKALRIEWFLFSYNTLEAIASIAFGILAGSIVLIGFGLDSIIETACVSILIWRLSICSGDNEEDMREKKALLFVAVTFFLLAAYVGYESISKLLNREAPHESIAGIIIAVLSLLIMPWLGLAKRKIARQIGSKALEADAMETILCSYLSAILLIGLGLNFLFGWWWADPVAGIVMIWFIVKEGLEALEARQSAL